MADNNLPAKLSWLQRRILGPELTQALEEASEILKREAELKRKEEDLEKRTSALAKREQELNQKAAEVSQEKNALGLEKEMVEAKKGALEKSIDSFREKEEVPPSISDSSIVRDQAISAALGIIREAAVKMQERQNTRAGVEETDKEKAARDMEIARLKAKLVGVVAAYRDLLPDDQLDFFSINGKSSAVFLKEQVEDIISLSGADKDKITIKTPKGSEFRISAAMARLAGDTYEKVARDDLKTWADLAYEHAAYYPFEHNFSAGDQRATHYVLIRNILGEETRSLKLTNKSLVGYDAGGYVMVAREGLLSSAAGAPRSVLDNSGKSEVEKGIEEVGAMMDEIDDR